LRIVLDYRPALRHRTGVGEFAHQMASALTRQAGSRDQITLFSSSWKDRLSPTVIPGAGTVDVRVPVSVLNYAWHRLAWPPVETFGADADVAWSLHPLLMPARRAAQVVTVHDLFFLDQPQATSGEVRRDYAPLAAAHAQRADGVIVVSEYTRDQVVRRLGVDAAKVTVCRLGAPEGTPRRQPATTGPILHVGTIEPRKNVPALLRAYARLRTLRGDAPPLVLAGRYDSPPPTQDGVEFRGYVSDAERARLFGEASMLVMASLDEGFGLPALEAMVAGIPVVASARGALPEVIGDAGLLVDPEDAQRFADAMARVLADGPLRRDLVARGIARAKAFSWDVAATNARQAFADAVERRKARR
jgi:glycosyltransferase involved in cell wall biosynthesis